MFRRFLQGLATAFSTREHSTIIDWDESGRVVRIPGVYPWHEVRVTRILLIVAAVLMMLLGAQTWRIAELQADIEGARADAAAAQAAASERMRALESSWAAKLQEAQHAREAETLRSRRAADALRADRDRLRVDIAAFAAGPSDDSVAACGERAAGLGVLLDDALRTAAACAAGAEQHASDLRAVLAAWPMKEAPAPE